MAAVGKLGWSGRCPACGAGPAAPGRWGAPRRGEVSYLRRGLGARGPGLGTETRHRGVPKRTCWLPPHPLPTPHRAPGSGPWERGGQASLPASQTDRSPRTEQWPKFLKRGEGKKGENVSISGESYAKTHMICNVSMRICIRYHHPSCHPGSGSAESYKGKSRSPPETPAKCQFSGGS